MVGGEGVVVVLVVAGRADVHGDIVEFGHVMQEPMMGLIGDVVGFDDAQGAVDDNAGLGPDPVANPAQP